MCRFLAYAGSSPVAPFDLAPTTFAEFRALSSMNADGWGMSWFADASVPMVTRSLQSAGEDPRFMEEASRSRGDIGIVHLRSATPPLRVDFQNSHPFLLGQYAMAHNGAIYPPWGQKAMDVATLDLIVPRDWKDRVKGQTDSERYFIAVMASIAAGNPVVEALRGVIALLVEQYKPSCLNTFLLDREALYVVSWFQAEPYPEEYYRLFSEEQLLHYFDLRYRLTADTFVIASTGWPQDGWMTMRRNHILRIERESLEITEYDLFTDEEAILPPVSGPVASAHEFNGGR